MSAEYFLVWKQEVKTKIPSKNMLILVHNLYILRLCFVIMVAGEVAVLTDRANSNTAVDIVLIMDCFLGFDPSLKSWAAGTYVLRVYV